jgi:hypothetical protein
MPDRASLDLGQSDSEAMYEVPGSRLRELTADITRLRGILSTAIEELTGFDDPADAYRLTLLEDFIVVAKDAIGHA